jgi:hypothetical protein
MDAFYVIGISFMETVDHYISILDILNKEDKINLLAKLTPLK